MAVQAIEPVIRPNEGTHRPHGLGAEARMIYDRAYSRAAITYARKHGGPAVKLDKLGTDHTPAERAKLAPILAERTIEHVLERHPSCHRSAMTALNKYQRARGLEPLADPAKPAKPAKPAAAKRTSTRKLAAVPDVTPAKPAAKRRKSAAPAKPAAEPAPAPAVVALEPVPAAPADEVAPYRTRKAARRELAAAMRADGLDPSDPVAWEAAKRAAGIR